MLAICGVWRRGRRSNNIYKAFNPLYRMKRGITLSVLLILVLFSSLVLAVNSSDVDRAYSCLENKIGDCSTLSTLEAAFSVLATPDNGFDECVAELESRQSGNNWGNVKDSALAILAMDHAGRNTDDARAWLNSTARNSTDLTWYVEIDSDSPTTCNIIYDNQTYSGIEIQADRSLSSGAGPCFARAKENNYLQMSSSCFEKTINVECDADFIVAFGFEYIGQSPAFHILQGTLGSSAYGSVDFDITSKCFGDGATCDFETTAWATYALLELGENVEDYVPYLAATRDGNTEYLPDAFFYLLTQYDQYSSSLLAEKEGDFWDVAGSPYSRFYDSALAILALGDSNQAVTSTIDWLYYTTDTAGCWQDSVRDTAFILWATEQKAGRPQGPGSTAYCEDVSSVDYFCVPSGTCSGDLLGSFQCTGSEVCCTNDTVLPSCSEINGTICSSGYTCAGGNSQLTNDSSSCCLGQCVEGTQSQTCSELNGTICSTSQTCSGNILSAASDSGRCCSSTCTSGNNGNGNGSAKGSLWWVWLLVILILIALGVLGWFFRGPIGEWWNKTFKKKGGAGGQPQQGGMPPRGPGIPPRAGPPGYNRQMITPPRGQNGLPQKPGFPPVRRQI
jgi:hypothetical protein